MLAGQTALPYALEIHHVVGYPKAASLSEWIGRWMSHVGLRFDASSAAKVRTVNKDVSATLVRWGIPAEKVEVVPSFYLDSALLKPDTSIEKRYDIVFCARLVANKGLLNVIRAVGSLPSATLLVIGDGPEKYPAMRLARELGIESRVTFVGWLPTAADVTAAIQSAKVFVMNSRSEGGPRVALEAMACGMPVGVMPDVLTDGENGLLTTGSAQDLAGKLTRLLADAELREKLGKAAQRVIDRFEKRALVERYAEFLKGIARQH
jgi:glycosyltransferase involved in cell wall biosynthesis